MSDASENRTELPTQRKLDRSREKGQIAYSADLVGGLTLLVSAGLIALLSDWFMSSLRLQLSQMLILLSEIESNADIVSFLLHFAWETGAICLPVLGISFFGSLLFGGVLTGFGVSPKAIEFDFDKINPVKGWSKLFSLRSVLRTLMSIFKLAVIATIVLVILKQQVYQVGDTSGRPFGLTVELTVDLVLQLIIGVAAGLVLLGATDLIFQKWKHIEDMKMSVQEIRDERKEDDGDPQLRARIRRLQREVSQRSLHDAVSSSTVVITNPTHFAVALKYDREMGAPVVVAKGKDFLALRIIDIAKLNDVAVVQRKPLARALYHNVEIGAEIPVELYQLVAEVLTFISTIDRQIS